MAPVSSPASGSPLGPVTANPTTPTSPIATSTRKCASGGRTIASCQAREASSAPVACTASARSADSDHTRR
ncbi:hypothetical protein [Tessaracoccus coleopterorum]|uniref:hypothetical protein n=1 Tax=Tessaracoccus coleopterorum TaxID=2714950 RepID=UPI001E4CD505|nr:hypothetical protein [Tessaracoccus coleopterorum]